MQGPFIIEKTLNNNVMIAKSSSGAEVIFIGKGISFGKKQGEVLEKQTYDKIFRLVDEQEQEKYKKLLSKGEEDLLLTIHEAIEVIHNRIGVQLHEKIHYALAQHLVLAMERNDNDTDVHNPFLMETKWLYHQTFQIAEEVVRFLYDKTGKMLSEAEAGFITLHIQGAITEEVTSEMKKDPSELIFNFTSYVEDKLNISLNKESLHFKRFVQHLKELFERSMTDEFPLEEKVLQLLKSENPLCYNIARNIVRMVEKTVQHSVSDVEIVYITIHLQRLIEDTNNHHLNV
ncbi:PRD domain-containing protein [Evansella sp. AB-rgal1]|uniref:PRD domain-containing protein n=1 Tax=Evansella sp. AB-rgal1 TaxID=3242696 RepID=UPI00359D2E4C